MKSLSKITFLIFMFIGSTLLSSFSLSEMNSVDHNTISRTIEKDIKGREIIKTEILLNRTTSREALIAACTSLGEEDVQLTFEALTIRKSFLGIMGKSRIAYAKGQIELPNGSSENFEAGGIFNFKSIKITHSQVDNTAEYVINMVEIVD